MPLASSFSAASSRGEGEFNLLQNSNTSVIIYAVSTIIAATPSSPSAGSVTYQTTTRHFLQVGWSVVIANVGGASSGSYNGTFTVNSVTDTTFTVTNSATGTATFPFSPLATVTPPTTWTCPSNVYNIHVLCIGAGGGGNTVGNAGSSKNTVYVYTSSPNGGTSAFKDGATTIIAASGGSGQTASSPSPVFVYGGGYVITPPLGTSYQGYGGGNGGDAGNGGGGAGGYSGKGGTAGDNSTFTISTTDATITTFVPPSPPYPYPTTSPGTTLVRTTVAHNYVVGDVVVIAGSSSSGTAIAGTGVILAVPSTTSFRWIQMNGGNSFSASSGGTARRIAMTGSGGSGGSGADEGLAGLSVGYSAGGGVWLNGTGALVPMNGYAKETYYPPTGGSSGVIVVSGSATASVATFTCDARYPPNIYLTSGADVDIWNLTAPFDVYNGNGFSQSITGTTATTFTMASLGTISGGATIATSGTAYPTAATGEFSAQGPSSSDTQGGDGGLFGGGGTGVAGGGAGGALAWLDNLSVIPGTTYTVQVGSGGLAPKPTATQRTITRASGNGTNIVYTYTGGNNAFSVNQNVTTSGINPTRYNLTNVAITAVTTSGFTIANSGTGTYVSGGTVTSLFSNYNYGGSGGHGAVRIMYGRDKQFPYTNVL